MRKPATDDNRRRLRLPSQMKRAWLKAMSGAIATAIMVHIIQAEAGSFAIPVAA